MTTMILDKSYDIEMDVADSYDPNQSSTQISSSSRSILINQQPRLATMDVNIHPTPDQSPSHIQIDTDPQMGISILWVNKVSRRMRIGSLVQMSGEKEVYQVVKVIKRSAKKETILCMAKDGHAIGLVVDSRHFKSSWNEVVMRSLLFTFFPCLFLL
jgi:spore germination protein GerM